VPYGVKDLLDTKDIPTTYGAEPFRNRVPAADSAVVRRLNDAGAVLSRSCRSAPWRSTTSGSAARR
jgi:Asp-tRNA(Asn)/Glu-tRNA(Gln) amidotransferase A subunit family amidase